MSDEVAAPGTRSAARRRALDILYEADLLERPIAEVLARHRDDPDAGAPDPYTVELVGGVVATVHVDVVCDPMPSEWDPEADPTAGHSEGTTAQVVQAVSKRAIAAGESAGGGTFVCDGSTVNPLDITVVSQTVPFKKGTAVVGVQLHICNVDCSGFGSRSTGPILVTLSSK